jgi:phospholipid/cholesterol/gamma-HCH transport system substrate-binding protein
MYNHVPNGAPPELSPRHGLGHRDTLRPERSKFRHVNEITGAFVLVVLAVLIAAVMWTSRSQRWFRSNVTLRIVLPEAGAAGIRQGSEVYFLGTLVGSVSDVIADSTGRMEAQAHIRHDFFRFVRADSSAVVKKKFGVAGDSFFEITRGEGRPLPENNASIVCNAQFSSALESAIEEIRVEALGVLKKASSSLDRWDKLGADLGETRQHLDHLTARLEKMTAGIEAGQGTVGKLIADSTLADDAQTLLARANESLSALQGMMTNLNAAVQNVQNGTARLPEITDAVANETKDLPGLVLQTQTSMRELERLVDAMQRHWLLRKYVNQTNPPPLRPIFEIPASEIKPVPNLHSPKGFAK